MRLGDRVSVAATAGKAGPGHRGCQGTLHYKIVNLRAFVKSRERVLALLRGVVAIEQRIISHSDALFTRPLKLFACRYTHSGSTTR